MYSPCRVKAAIAMCSAGVMLALVGCNREARQFNESPRHETNAPTDNRMNSLVSGEVSPAYRLEKQHQFEENAYQISEGKRLYSWYNCTGCHAHGGGDIGPPLMDEKWIYGGEIDQIYMTIAEGRPNGMPSFAAKLTSEEIWQLSAYVRTLSGHGPKAARSGRDDHMQMPAEQGRREEGVLPEVPADSGAG